MDASLPARVLHLLLRIGTGFGLFRRLGCLLFGEKITAVAALTIKAAFRYRLVVVLLALLVMAVVGLPLIIKHDGTARGFTQVLLTYTLGSMTALLGFCTLWLACGTLARDIEDCQMQVVVVKPIARWQVWLGKWLGIAALNILLIAFSGAVIYALVHLRARQLSPKEQQTLHKQVLVGRGSLKEPLQDLGPTVDLHYEELLRQRPETAQMNRDEVKKALHERLRAEEQIVRPNFRRRWQFDLTQLGLLETFRDKPLRLRIKFHSSQSTPLDIWTCRWMIGPPEDPAVAPKEYVMRVQAGGFHEFDVAPNMFDSKGLLTIEYWNYNDRAMLFPQEDGFEVLYPETGFGLNFARGLAIILFWIGLLAAIGLAAGSYLSFPVAAFVSLSVLLVASSSGVMAEVVKDGTLYMTAHEGEVQAQVKRPLDTVMVPVFKQLLTVVNLVQDFAPVDSLSTGRSIYWKTVFAAFAKITLFMTGLFAVLGIWLFHQRELATAQSQQ
jgi:hypothetical protein